MNTLPSGTVTFLFTDIEGSTRLLNELGAEAYADALAEHRRVIREACKQYGGLEVDTVGDAFFVAFATAPEALAAARQATEALAGGPIRVRIGVHTGTPLSTVEGYVGADVHRAARIAAAGHGGQVLVSQATASLVDHDELRDLGEHRFKDLAAPERVFQLGRGDFPPLKSLYRTNLPIPPTPFVGRESELAEVTAQLVRDDVRLLTLTGSGGSGKTRLALQAAAQASDGYPDGVFWVGLGPLRDPALVTESIVQVLGAEENLSGHIGSKRLLLLLDNFEHLIAASTELGGLLSACPELALLVTSREPLQLSAEREYRVLPLRETDATLLFRERAQAASIAVTEDGDVAEICRRLDHLPLAIELAAARVKVLSPRALLERLEQRLSLLTGGPHDLPERQRTLRATIDWSYELLTAGEQRLFARLAVFAGGCTLEAAERTCEAELDTLQSLVDKSLLRHSAERFWMLETIMEYATERLDESDEAPELRQRYAHWHLELAERAYPELRGAEQATWLERLEQEHDNFRSVLGLKLSTGESETALRLASLLSRFWMVRGYLAEGSRWLETCLRSAGMSAVRSRALRGQAILSKEQGRIERAAEAAEEALALDRASGDEDGAAQSMGILADVVAFRGDLVAAERLYEEAAELARRRGDRLELAITLYNLGHLARLQRDLSRAGDRFEEALATFRDVGDVMGQAGVLHGLVEVASESGDHERAFSFLRVSTELLKEIRYVSGLLDSLDTAAGLLAKLGEAESAARLWGAYHVLGEEIGRAAAHPLEAAARDESAGAVRETLGDQLFERAWTEGGRLTLDQAVALALERDPSAAEIA